MRDSCSTARHLTANAADQLPPPLHVLHVHPSVVHPTPSPSVRRKSHSLLFPELPSSSCHSTRPAIAAMARPPSTAASGHTCSTPSTARVPGTSTSTLTPASNPSPVYHRRLFPARTRRRGELPSVSLPPPFASNRSHHRPGPLSSRFPSDQRRPADRISPASGGWGNFPPLFSPCGPKQP
jgi:hypothetical protein